MRAPFYRWEEIEAVADRLHRELEEVLGEPPEMPIDVDIIGEQLLGLSWLYERIPEPPGVTILAALHPEHRLVVLNERHVEIFGRNEGLERFTKAHELGHWVLHARGDRRQGTGDRGGSGHRPLRGRPAVGGASDGDGLRSSSISSLSVLWCSQAERRWQEIQANWFAAALLMPPLPLRRAAAEVDVMGWRGRYELSGRCGVSISALNSRLRQLGYPAVR